MPKVILMAKTVLVWLYQLSKKYNRDISRLDQIPDEELDALRDAGFTGLWLIGLWERSNASKRIKQINGNPEAASSAYSLLNYEIAGNLGGLHWKTCAGGAGREEFVLPPTWCRTTRVWTATGLQNTLTTSSPLRTAQVQVTLSTVKI